MFLTSIKIVPLNVVYFLLIYCNTKTLYKKWLTFFDIVIDSLDEVVFEVGEWVQGSADDEDGHNAVACLEIDGKQTRDYEVVHHCHN